MYAASPRASSPAGREVESGLLSSVTRVLSRTHSLMEGSGGGGIGPKSGESCHVRAGCATALGAGLELVRADGRGETVAWVVSFDCWGSTRLTAISTPPTRAITARPTIIRSPAVLDGRRPSDVDSGT